jgi:diacylglycerol O-acyltransferase
MQFQSEPNRDRVDAVDRAWLRMDDPTNHMVVTALLLFEGELDGARVRALLRERLAGIPRMRASVEAGTLGLWHRWREHERFDVDAHVCESALPEPGDEAALNAMIGETMSKPLDPQQPLWELHVIHGLRDVQGARAAVLTRVHHALGDGIAQMLLLLSLTDIEPNSSRANPLRELFTMDARARPQDLKAARRFIHEVMPHGMKLLLRGDLRQLEDHRHQPDLGRQARRLAGASRSLASLLLRRPDVSTVLRGSLGVGKRAACSTALPLDRVHAISHELGVTIHDLLLTALCGGLRRYLLDRRESPEGVELRAAVPINLRGLAEMAKLGNRFGLLFLTLPIHLSEPDERLAELRRRMLALEHSAEPLVTYAVLDLIGHTPKLFEELVLDYFARRVSLVVTNVPGPERPLWLAGQKLAGMMFWVPQSGRVGLGVSICSYAGHVRLGIASDAGLIPEPARIIAGFQAEFDELAERAKI